MLAANKGKNYESVEDGWVVNIGRKPSPALLEKQSNTSLSFPSKLQLSDLPWPLIIFIITIITPTASSIYAGPLRLTLVRIAIIIMFIPTFVKVFSGQRGKILLCDFCVLFYAFWPFISLSTLHPFSRTVEAGGIHLLESLGPYLVARTFITNHRTFWAACLLMMVIIISLLLVTIPENLTSKNIMWNIFGAQSRPNFRKGFFRAYGPLDHPIHLGVFCGSVIAIAWYMFRKNMFKRIMVTGAIMLSAATSISSGPILSMVMQIFLISWQSILSFHKKKWTLLISIVGSAYVFLLFASNRGPVQLILSIITFNPGTANNRIIIYQYGIQDVINNPIFGIGFNVWSKPAWMHSNSMDTYWLYTAVTYGIPSFLAVFGAVLYLLIRIGKRDFKDDSLKALKLGWIFSIVGVSFSAATVHFWSVLHIYFFFLVGMGAWFLNREYDQQ